MNKLLHILIILLTFSSCRRDCDIGYLEEPVVKIQFLKKDSCLNIFGEPAQCYNPTLINYDSYKALNVEKEVDLNQKENYYYFPLNMNEDVIEYYLIDNYPNKIDTIRIEYERSINSVSKHCDVSFNYSRLSILSTYDSVRVRDDYYDDNVIYIHLD